ncbi:MAG: hypothetical protein OXH00_02665 [Candidatus Poribacteria bacterium]|nr:hypothetical protein [Candidatus Poribacteria bacterium]
MHKRLISQLKDTPNRLKITPPSKLAIIYLDAAFVEQGAYFQLIPIGEWNQWQHFWDIWDLHKTDLTVEGLYVRKKQGVWTIRYKPLRGIELDESITRFQGI